MGRPGITYDQVAAAADAQVGAGKSPTNASVREALGGTGGAGTIQKHMTTWKAARPKAQAVARTLPGRIIDSISDEIQKAVAEARSEIELQLVQVQADATDLATGSDALEVQVEDLMEQLKEVGTDRDAATATAAERALEIDRLSQQVAREQAAAESARIELAKSQLKNESVQARLVEVAADLAEQKVIAGEQLAGSKVALDGERTSRISAEQSAAVLTAKLESATDRVAKSDARIEQFEAKANTASTELMQERIRVQAQQSALDAAMRELDVAKIATKEAKTAAEKAIGDAAAAVRKATEEAAELRGKLLALTPTAVQSTLSPLA
jgi:chromosome segregation ATPase